MNIHGFVPSVPSLVPSCVARSQLDSLPPPLLSSGPTAAVCENGLKISGSPSDCPSVRARSVELIGERGEGERLNLWKNATDMNEIKWRW